MPADPQDPRPLLAAGPLPLGRDLVIASEADRHHPELKTWSESAVWAHRTELHRSTTPCLEMSWFVRETVQLFLPAYWVIFDWCFCAFGVSLLPRWNRICKLLIEQTFVRDFGTARTNSVR